MSTPLRQQYLDIKRRYPGMLLLFQIGDFYETFDEDARIVARELGVALTRKWFGKTDVRPLAGVPVRSLEGHLGKLIRKGYKVAVCDQVTPPGKGLVEREVVRIVTPGTVLEPGLLPDRGNNYLASVVRGGPADAGAWGLAYADLSTGEFRVAEFEREEALAELLRLLPAELVLPRSLEPAALLDRELDAAEVPAAGEARPGYGPERPPGALPVRALTRLPDEEVDLDRARETLLSHFGATTLAPYGCEDRPLLIRAAAAILAYLRDTQPDALSNLTRLQSYHGAHFMRLDPQTLANLEVFRGFAEDSPAGSLVERLDLCITPMGGRLLRRWLRYPLLDLAELSARQDRVAWFLQNAPARTAARQALQGVQDIERLIARIRRLRAVPAELLALAQSLRALGPLRAACAHYPAAEPLLECADVVCLVERAISDAAPAELGRGGVLRPGFSAELDSLRATLGGGRRFLAEYEERERKRTGIRSLKVGFNKVFGHYIEVTKPNLPLVPTDYVRKQTLAHAERFFTLELKEQESLLQNARDRLGELEASLYRRLCDEIGAHHEEVQRAAAALARVDLHAALAECAARHRYVRPQLHEGDEILLQQARHPIAEQMVPFVPNDARLCTQDQQIIILTAPNMAGKSVYLKQVALLCLMAQIGSFVPAQEARVGLLDRIFTRLGLTDSTRRGHSSFMSEMVELAHILHQATPRSLVVLDEIGRGTATADGLAIARSVVEYLHNHPRLQAKTLFATHYHELSACASYLPRVRNYHLLVRENDGRVEYLHRVAAGVAEKSFGLHVAQLAGLPQPVLRRARELLRQHEQSQAARTPPPAGTAASAVAGRVPPGLLDFLRELCALDPNGLSPIEALTRLYSLQREARAWLE